MKTYTADYRVHTNQAAQVSLHDSTSDRGVRLEGGGGDAGQRNLSLVRIL